MRKRKKTCEREELEGLSTEQLDMLLQAELQKESPDEEVVLSILDVLHKRENAPAADVSEGMSATPGKNKGHNSPPVKKIGKQRWLLSATAVAAAVCLIVMALPRAVGAESIFDVLFRWTSTVFQFVKPDTNESTPKAADSFTTNNPGLQQLRDELAALGIADPVVPMWVPDGFTLSELKVTPMPDGSKVRAKLESGNSGIALSYRVLASTAPMEYEKGDMPVELYEFSGNDHFIMDNEGNLFVAWNIDGVECTISTDLDKENVYKIIKSIYRSDIG